MAITSDNSDDYFDRFKPIFNIDFDFSRNFKKQIKPILHKNFLRIIDHENHDSADDVAKDKQGIDTTGTIHLDIPLGIRVRRFYAIYWAQFTVDFKEWRHGQAKYYFFAYADYQESELVFYIVFNYHSLKRLVELGKIPDDVIYQDVHSKVPAHVFPLSDIVEQCEIFDFWISPKLERNSHTERVFRAFEILKKKPNRLENFVESD